MNSIIKKIEISFLCLLFLIPTISAQSNVKGDVFVTNVLSGNAVKVKWLSKNVYTKKPINLYRREGNGSWEKLNTTPIDRLGSIDLPENQKSKLEKLLEDKPFPEDPLELKGLEKLLLISEVFINDKVAEFYGIAFTDLTVKSGKTYTYKVMLLSASGEKEFGQSQAIKVQKVKDFAPPKSIAVTVPEKADSVVNIIWTAETGRYFGVNVYRKKGANGNWEKYTKKPVLVSKQKGKTPPFFFQSTDNTPGETYSYQLKAVDFFGRESKASKAFKVTMPDLGKPLVPALSEVRRKSAEEILFLWEDSESIKVKGYQVYVSTSVDAPFQKAHKGLIESGVEQFTYKIPDWNSYFFYVEVVGENGQVNRSRTTGLDMLDVIPPEAPKGLTIKSEAGKITISWKANKEDDLLGYRVYRSIANEPDIPYACITPEELKTSSFTDQLDKVYKNKFFYKVAALDKELNISELSERIGAVMPDVTPPNPPFIKKIEIGEKTVTIEWLPSMEKDLSGYELFRSADKTTGFTSLAKISNRETISYTDEAIKEGEKYYYRLLAIDQDGNKSEPSEPYAARPFGISKARAVKDFTVKYDKRSKKVQLSWKTGTTEGIIGAIVVRSNGFSDLNPASPMIKGSTYTDDKVEEAQQYVYAVRVYYENGTTVSTETKNIQTK